MRRQSEGLWMDSCFEEWRGARDKVAAQLKRVRWLVDSAVTAVDRRIS